MLTLGNLVRRRRTIQIARVADQAAGELIETGWQLVQTGLDAVTQSEAAGYIRARVGSLVATRVASRLANEQELQAYADEVRSQTMGQVESMLLQRHAATQADRRPRRSA